MRSLWVAALAAMVLVPASAGAEPANTPALQTCLDSAAGSSTMGQIQCIGVELKVQDKRLNQAYAQVMADLNPRQQARLRSAQRAWIAFRDADCVALYDEDWGTLSRVNANYCVMQRTAERADYLVDYLKP